MNRLLSVESDLDDVKTTVCTYPWDNCAGHVYSRAQGIRRAVGMTSILAIVWNVGAPDEVLHPGVGVAHSSVEASVMDVERRSGHVREDERINRETGRNT
jgi:hypothetical protein